MLVEINPFNVAKLCCSNLDMTSYSFQEQGNRDIYLDGY